MLIIRHKFLINYCLLLKIEGNEVCKTNWNFNAYNALAIYGTAVELGMDSLETLRLLSELESFG
jgi:UDP-N-acetylmuramoyl-L-alanyl-D-glutamate--2,6-diaminopimelate ligase